MTYLYKPKGIVLHCTASNNNYTLEQLYKDHIRRGFDMIGYHYVIKDDGTIIETRPLDKLGAHAKGYNNYIGIAYIGGIYNGKPKNTMNKYQEESLGILVHGLMEIYNFKVEDILLHNEIAKKECPCFKREFLYNLITNAIWPTFPNQLIENIKQYGLCVHSR